MRINFADAGYAIHQLRKEHALKSHESSVEITERIFNCTIIWDHGDCFLEFNNEQSYILFLLRGK